MPANSLLSAWSLSRHALTSEGKIQILQDVSLQLEAGQSLAIQGASGSGKSTLLSLLAGLDLADGGSVNFLGKCLNDLSEDQRADLRAQQIGFVFQSFFLVDDLTASENVALPLELFAYADAKQAADDWLTRLGLSERLHQFPKKLSGGEQQRVALARAFAIQPCLILADEPTANLDATTADTVLEQLFKLQKTQGTGMVIATHDDALAARCDAVLRLDAGKIVQGG